ncbi:DedA family protein [Brevibacillus sp. GCM10020057]|uniref:DedA family protein n=1 Tax=Brevibacillus sp. GCM10020057 TaxID=3317327 RepID=UPI0036399F18
MVVEMLTDSVGQFGYFALFFLLWLGIVGMPIPDEVIVLSAGVLTATDVLGRTVGAPALQWIGRKKGMNKYVAHAQSLLERYCSYALCISCRRVRLPGVEAAQGTEHGASQRTERRLQGIRQVAIADAIAIATASRGTAAVRRRFPALDGFTPCERDVSLVF